MIIVKSLKNSDTNPRTFLVSLFSDTKAEVATTAVDDIVGFPKGGEIETSSTVVTADADFAFYKSDGTWNWI